MKKTIVYVLLFVLAISAVYAGSIKDLDYKDKPCIVCKDKNREINDNNVQIDADTAGHADTADYADEAGHADSADHADTADYAKKAKKAKHAKKADKADYANRAGYAYKAGYSHRAGYSYYASNSNRLDGKHGSYYTGHSDDGDEEIYAYLQSRENDYLEKNGGNSIQWLSSVFFGSMMPNYISDMPYDTFMDYFVAKFVSRDIYRRDIVETNQRMDYLEAKINLGNYATQEEIDMETCFVCARRSGGKCTTAKMSCTV